MKKVKHYFKNGKIKYTECDRLVVEDVVKYKFKNIEVKDVLIIVTEGKKTIEFIYQYGCELFYKKKRSKTLKYSGTEISRDLFINIVRDFKNDAYINFAELQNKDEKIYNQLKLFPNMNKL